jgi:hypothetical protein
MNQQTIKVIVDLHEKLKGYEECVPKFERMTLSMNSYEYSVSSPITYVKRVNSEIHEYFKPLVEEFIKDRIRQITKELESL